MVYRRRFANDNNKTLALIQFQEYPSLMRSLFKTATRKYQRAEKRDQVIDVRRVHSNTALFVALTVATPNVTWAARALWMAS